ncbi:MAG: exodeoxyribonuclease VII small subunit [Bacteroidaceae bacterium]|nr:exodeoxyribonuclease VII small subunit [Prevotellaceae bacterium]MDY5630969.1 exodeoxyribonuclease VII small subunit [Bacteroidaceae bacterium]
MNYEEAMQRLEQIADQMERGETGIDKMAALLQEAQKLLKQCRRQLTDAEAQCNTLLGENANEGE